MDGIAPPIAVQINGVIEWTTGGLISRFLMPNQPLYTAMQMNMVKYIPTLVHIAVTACRSAEAIS